MHELPIVQSTLKQVLQTASLHKAKNVTHIHLVLGEFSGFVDESIQFYWPLVAKNTIAESAQITISRKPGMLKCLSCHSKISAQSLPNICPHCANHRLKITSGNQYQLDYIEVS